MDEEHIEPVNENKSVSGETQKPDEKPPVAPADVSELGAKESPRTSHPDWNNGKRKPLSRFEIWTIVLGSLGILVAAATGIAIYRQAKIGSDTLIEIRKQYPEMQKSSNAAKTAADIAELSERPWIKIVDVKTRGNNPVVPALSFTGFGHGPFPKGNQQVNFQIDVSLKNVGHSVADLAVDHELFLPLWDMYFNMIMAEEEKFCGQSWHAKSESPAKAELFPDESFDWYGASGAFPAQDHINHFDKGNPAGYVIPTEVVCVNYRLSGSDKVYQTRALYEVFRRDNRTRFFDTGIDVKARDIFLIREQFGDSAY
jgi:hypothetical protein